MPRFRIIRSEASDASDDSGQHENSDDFDDLHDRFDDGPARRRRRGNRPPDAAPRLVLEGRSGRVLVDSDAAAGESEMLDGLAGGPPLEGESSAGPFSGDDAPFSSYDTATHGPDPVPDWLVTSLSARDTRLGVIKTGKEADVGLLDRSLPGGPGCLLAVKSSRSADHRMFHRDAGYLEGRRVRRSRETRAMATRTGFGRELLAGQWAKAEFGALSRIWKAGARVPYPVQVIGSELMMQFIGEPDGTAAPRLAVFDAGTSEFTDLWHDLVATLEVRRVRTDPWGPVAVQRAGRRKRLRAH